MNIQNWKIFDKKGSNLNWIPLSTVNLKIESPTGKNAEGFLIVDPSGFVVDTKITNEGYLYDNNDVSVFYTYDYATGVFPLSSTEATIITRDISIFNPEGITTKSISDINVTLDASFVYPSVTYAAAVFLEPVSQGLVETEHLSILEQDGSSYIRPYDASNYILIMELVGEEDEIQFFDVNEWTNEITWTNVIAFDISTYAPNVPLQVNIGFKSDVEGVFERILRMYHLVDDTLYIIADIVVNAESIGEDERHRTLLGNFGLPDPKDILQLFKESDINEDYPDWKLLNQKSKHMILEHDKIMPYVGTYKALINAVKWLGYDDIYFREWFLDVKDIQRKTRLSFLVSYSAPDVFDYITGKKVLGRTQTIQMFDPRQRQTLKKLNQLSMFYCITRETGFLDDYGTPLTENCYAYNLKEVFVKLNALKKWLEKYIIGVNCRIIDITGEGVYFERVKNLVYSTDNIGFNYNVHQPLTPYALDVNSELVQGDASIRLSIKEINDLTIKNLTCRFIDMAHSAWNPNTPNVYYSLQDPSYLANPSNYMLVGATFGYPLEHVNEISYRLSVEKDNAGVIGSTLVTNPLFIYENDIRFYNILDVSSVFYDVSSNLTIYLEKAYLRDPSIDDIWANSIAYTISPVTHITIDASDSKNLRSKGEYKITSGRGILVTKDSSIIYNIVNKPYLFTLTKDASVIAEEETVIITPYIDHYVMESSSGTINTFYDYVSFHWEPGSRLQYVYDNDYEVPLLKFRNYYAIDGVGDRISLGNKEYILDILDGKIEMNAGLTSSSDNLMSYINWHYDTSIEEQMITTNFVYTSPRVPLWQINPTVYYNGDPSAFTGGNAPGIYEIDNSIHVMHVNHIGDYTLELRAWDGYNTLIYNKALTPYKVWVKSPNIYLLVDNSTFMGYDVSKYMSMAEVNTLISRNRYPIYDRYISLQGLKIEFDNTGRPYIKIPSVTYFQDVMEPYSLNRITNITERILTRSGNTITVDKDFQNFITGDQVQILQYSRENYSLIQEISANIVSATLTNPASITLNALPASFVTNASNALFILNDTRREVTTVSNNETSYVADIANYSFKEQQAVALIATDINNGYSWGATYRVVDVSGNRHTFDKPLPELFLDTSIYEIRAKHAFSAFTNFIMTTESAIEKNNEFSIYHSDSYCREYYLDNTFTLTNIQFDHDRINDMWYDPSLYLVNSNFYYYNKAIEVDTSTLVILRAEYDPSNYMLNQKNIWTARYVNNNAMYFRVFNESVPIIFKDSVNFSIGVESYDSYGNLIQELF